jgi:hypothetical protein
MSHQDTIFTRRNCSQCFTLRAEEHRPRRTATP